MKLQAYVATFLGMLLAFLVIFNTLNMSVSEQIRQFAMLRAICLTRAQVTMVIFFEGMTIACLGFIAGVIVRPGGVLSFAGSLSKNVLHHGASVGPDRRHFGGHCYLWCRVPGLARAGMACHSNSTT